MITLLRRIRKSLIESGPSFAKACPSAEATGGTRTAGEATRKPASPVSGGHSLWRRDAGRYILYAIGEIILVEIGILIAPQINNWNEWVNDRKEENKTND